MDIKQEVFVMQNKKMRNIEILAVIILATILFMGSAYVIVSDNYRNLLYKPKEKKLMAEQYYANEAKRVYQWSVHEQNMADIRHFLDEKSQRLDSMRNIHYQIENDFLYKEDSCYKLYKLYKANNSVIYPENINWRSTARTKFECIMNHDQESIQLIVKGPGVVIDEDE